MKTFLQAQDSGQEAPGRRLAPSTTGALASASIGGLVVLGVSYVSVYATSDAAPFLFFFSYFVAAPLGAALACVLAHRWNVGVGYVKISLTTLGLALLAVLLIGTGFPFFVGLLLLAPIEIIEVIGVGWAAKRWFARSKGAPGN